LAERLAVVPAPAADIGRPPQVGGVPGSPAAWIAPVGLLPDVPLPVIEAMARRITDAVSHDATAADVAAIQAVAVAMATRGCAGDPLRPDELGVILASHARRPETVHALQSVVSLAGQRLDPDRLAQRFDRHHPAVRPFAVALAIFLTHPDEPAAAVAAGLLAHGHGGITATMTAAMCGARLGDRATPVGWGSRLQSSLLVWTAAQELARSAPPPVDGAGEQEHRRTTDH
jgi:ADP-ribosylglycohydrolase